MNDLPPGVSNDRAVAAIMARAVMLIVFVGSGISLALLFAGSSLAGTVCIGSGVLAGVALLVGAYYVARARSA